MKNQFRDFLNSIENALSLTETDSENGHDYFAIIDLIDIEERLEQKLEIGSEDKTFELQLRQLLDRCYAGIATCHFFQKNYTETLNYFSKVDDTFSFRPSPRTALAYAKTLISMNTPESLNAADTLLKKIRGENPTITQVTYLLRGLIALQQSDPTTADTYFSELCHHLTASNNILAFTPMVNIFIPKETVKSLSGQLDSLDHLLGLGNIDRTIPALPVINIYSAEETFSPTLFSPLSYRSNTPPCLADTWQDISPSPTRTS